MKNKPTRLNQTKEVVLLCALRYSMYQDASAARTVSKEVVANITKVSRTFLDIADFELKVHMENLSGDDKNNAFFFDLWGDAYEAVQRELIERGPDGD